MRARALVIVSGLILVVLAGQTSLQGSQTKLDPPVVAACSVQGEGCDQSTLDGSRQSVISHHVFAGGCPGADLHIMKYVREGERRSAPLVASWCS
jgi:hypothetical protein